MKISVIIPTYNREKTILRSINSVLNQTHPVDEIIVVDDCGSDNTASLVGSIANGKIKYVKLDENRGAAGARNYGVSVAGYDWIAFHDSDDEWHPDKIEKQVNYINTHPNCRFVYCSYHIEADNSDVPLCYKLDQYDGEILPTLLYRNTVGAPTILMEKALFNELNGFNTSMRALEDWDFAIKVAKNCPLGFVHESLMTVYRVDSSLSTSLSNYFQYKCQIIASYLSDYQKYNCFETMVTGTYMEAKSFGLESQFERMLSLYLTR